MYWQSEKNWLNSNTSSTCRRNMVNFGPLMAEICWRVWGTPANFNGFRVLAALLHGTLVVSVSQTLRRWTEGATYIWQAAITLGVGPHSSLVIIQMIIIDLHSACCLHETGFIYLLIVYYSWCSVARHWVFAFSRRRRRDYLAYYYFYLIMIHFAHSCIFAFFVTVV